MNLTHGVGVALNLSFLLALLLLFFLLFFFLVLVRSFSEEDPELEDNRLLVEDEEVRDEIVEDDPVELEEFVEVTVRGFFCELGGLGGLGVPETRMRVGELAEGKEEVCCSLALACRVEGVM